MEQTIFGALSTFSLLPAAAGDVEAHLRFDLVNGDPAAVLRVNISERDAADLIGALGKPHKITMTIEQLP